MKLHFSSNVASESALSFDNFSFPSVIQENDVGEIRSPRTDLVNQAGRTLIQFRKIPNSNRLDKDGGLTGYIIIDVTDSVLA